MADTELKKKEDAELREYQKRSLAARAVTAVLALAAAGIAGYLGRKTGSR